eukprot:TRINITY_DN3567_c0_g1_i4.p1 TRINITY_DN3567_c0_g1~~TRINITY_DN3567_c0_g1_i4.p1  ORF type:complete len:846 (+),score=132.23 TRINITY_DN3567_c0_g1_i4:48-2540(+)
MAAVGESADRNDDVGDAAHVKVEESSVIDSDAGRPSAVAGATAGAGGSSVASGYASKSLLSVPVSEDSAFVKVEADTLTSVSGPSAATSGVKVEAAAAGYGREEVSVRDSAKSDLSGYAREEASVRDSAKSDFSAVPGFGREEVSAGSRSHISQASDSMSHLDPLPADNLSAAARSVSQVCTQNTFASGEEDIALPDTRSHFSQSVAADYTDGFHSQTGGHTVEHTRSVPASTVGNTTVPAAVLEFPGDSFDAAVKHLFRATGDERRERRARNLQRMRVAADNAAEMAAHDPGRVGRRSGVALWPDSVRTQPHLMNPTISQRLYGFMRSLPAALAASVELRGRGSQEVPYDQADPRAAWKGSGKLPIFSNRPAYTEIGLRYKKPTTGLHAPDIPVPDARETMEQRAGRFHTGIKESFRTAARIDSEWVQLLDQIGASINLQPLDVSRDGIEVRSDLLYLASHCTLEGLKALPHAIEKVECSGAAAMANSLPELDLSMRRLAGLSEDFLKRHWAIDWEQWAQKYERALEAQGMPVSQRTPSSQMSLPSIVRRPSGVDAQLRKALLHPHYITDNSGQPPRIVAVRPLLPEDPRVASRQGALVLGHFVTGDPMPVDRVLAARGLPAGKDFTSLPHAEQVEARRSIPDELYDGAMLVEASGAPGLVEFCLPAKGDPLPENEIARVRRAEEGIAAHELTAAWQLGGVDCPPQAVECSVVQKYVDRTRSVHKRSLIMRETSTALYVSYPEFKKTLEQSGPENVNASQMRQVLAEEHRDLRGVAPRTIQKYAVSWVDDGGHLLGDPKAKRMRLASAESATASDGGTPVSVGTPQQSQ